MGTLDKVDIDTGAVELEGGQFRDELLTFAGLDTFVKGTLLARQRVALTFTPSAVTGTGNGTCTAGTVVAGQNVPKVGNYKLTCVTAITNGGTFRLDDPDGQEVAGSLTLTVGAGAATVLKAGGLQFTVTDGSTDFVVGDFFTLPIAANGTNGKLVPFNPATGAGGAQLPTHVLTYEVSKAGAGDVIVRAFCFGRVKKERLIIDVDGTGANVTAAILDQLRAEGITAIDTKQLAVLDN